MQKVPEDFRGIPDHLKMMKRLSQPGQIALKRLSCLRAYLERYTAVNAYGKGDAHVSLSFLGHPMKEKSDAFIITARTEKELEVWVSDGGFATGETLEIVLGLRRQLLRAAGLEKEENNPRYKLEVTFLVSHFHIDHVNECIYHLLPCPFLRVKRIYHPRISAYAKDTNHDENCNGDKGIRTRFMLSQQAYQPLADMVELDFGQVLTAPLGEGSITMMMPDRDWGTPENAREVARIYRHAEMTEEKRRRAMPVQVVNCNCIVARIDYKGRRMLLTGDAMKKNFDSDDEPLDLLVKQHGDALRADIVKYPHHGQARHPAWKTVRDDMLIPGPDAMVVLTGHDGCNQGGKYLTENGVAWMDIREGTLTFTINEKGEIHRMRDEVVRL